MTPAQWAHLGMAHAEREKNERLFQVELVSKSFEALKDMLMALLGSESSLPDNRPAGQFVPLITALATPERLEAFKTVQQGGSVRDEEAFFSQLREKAEALNAMPQPSTVAAEINDTQMVNKDAGSFDADLAALFAPYLDKDE